MSSRIPSPTRWSSRNASANFGSCRTSRQRAENFVDNDKPHDAPQFITRRVMSTMNRKSNCIRYDIADHRCLKGFPINCCRHTLFRRGPGWHSFWADVERKTAFQQSHNSRNRVFQFLKNRSHPRIDTTHYTLCAVVGGAMFVIFCGGYCQENFTGCVCCGNLVACNLLRRVG